MQLIHGECLEEMAKLPDDSVDMVLTDPPYFKVKGEAWDRQWDKPQHFLEWLDKCAEQWARLLKPNGSLYCFASPQMSARVEVLLRERFNVLNSIRWVKHHANVKRRHDAQIVSKGLARSWLPAWEGCVFAEHYGADNIAKGEAGYAAKCDELRGFVFEPLRAYLAGERDRAGFTTRMVAEAFQRRTGSRTVTGMAGHWFERVQWALPTKANYEWLRELFNMRGDSKNIKTGAEYLRREYEDLRREYEDLRREYEDLRRPFSVRPDVPYTDVWTFEPVRPYKGKHPCEKPQDMLRHIILASTRPTNVVLDCFMGSGSAGIACRDTGRDFIGVELDKGYFETAQRRIASAAGPHVETEDYIDA